MKRAGFFLAAAFCAAMVSTPTAGATITSTGTGGNWSSTATWVGGVVPASGDDVVIADGATVTIDTAVPSTGSLASLTVGQGTSGTLTFDSTARTVSVSGSVTVSSGATFITQSSGAATHAMTIGGDLTNNGTFDMSRGGTTLLCDVTFNQNGNQTVGGSGSTTRFNAITVNLGTSQSNVLEINSSNFSAKDPFLTLTNGTLKMSGSYSLTNRFFTTSGYTIAASTGIWLNNSNVTVSAQNASPQNNGLLRITSGAYNVGTASGNSLTYIGGSKFTIEGGALNVAGRLSRNGVGSTTTYSQSGGTVTVVTSGSSSTSFAGFDIGASGSSFTMSGGIIVVQNSTGNTDANGGDYLNKAGTANVTGGTVHIGNASTGASTTIRIDSTAPLFNLTVNTTNSPTAKLINDALTIKGTLTIQSGASLNANSLNLSIAADWSNAGTFTSGTQTTTFNGSSNQTISGSLPTTFSGLAISNAAGVTLSQNITVTANLGLTNGDITTGSNTLFMGNGGTSSGTGDVVGSVNRGDIGATTRSFGNPDVQVTETGTVTDMTVKLVKGSTANDFTNSVKRIYTITANNGTNTTATIRLHYLDGELNGNTESSLDLYRKDPTLGWQDKLQTTRHDDTTGDQNWVELAGVTSFSDWTLANTGLSPTDVAMLSARATRFDNRVLLEWQTGYEVHNVGFNIYREKNGNLEKVTTEPVAGSALIGGLRVAFTAGLAYTWWDNQVDDTTTRYWIEDIDLSGRTTSHGPFPVQPAPAGQTLPPGKGNSPSLGAINDPATAPDYGAQVQPKAGPVAATNARLSLQSTLASAQAVKLSVKQAGWYHVEQSELVADGLSASVDPHRLQLFVDGQEVPIIVTGDADGKFDPGDAIEFYGIGIDSPSTDSHIYWLTEGTENGKRIAKVPPPARQAQPGASAFSFTVERRDKVVYFPALKNGGGEKFFGPLIYDAQPVDQLLTIQSVAASGSGATLEVSLQGFTQTDHSVRVVFNGTELGTVAFSGMAKAVAQYSIPQSALKEGANQVQFIGPSGFNDMSLVEYARLTYTHSNTADSNTLRLSVAGRFLSTIGGFASPAVRVIDVTVPNIPWELTVDVKKDASGFYTATVAAPGKGPRTLLAFTPDQQKKPAAMVLNQPSSWRYEFNAADYVVVTRKDLIDSLAPLASQRRSQGLATVVVDIEDVYDEFSFGNKTPQALKDFLSYSRSNWSTAPRFVLLAGDATYDPKNYLGVGDFDLVPTKLVEMLFNETATDDWFVDADGDGVPDVAIGRLPVRTTNEAAALVSKIVVYDRSTPSARVMLIADTNQGYDFESANQQLKSLIPSKLTVADIRRGQQGDSTARSQLLEGFNQGQKVVNYYGHGSTRVWANAPLLTASDASGFTNQGALSLVSAMTCLSGYFQDPSIESLGEALLKAQGGAVAVWASSGMTDASAQVRMSQEAIKQLMSSPDLTIGEATARAKAATTDADVRRTWILLGDPATKLR